MAELPMSSILFGVALLLLAAKIGGEISEKLLKQPAVLGELIGGMLVAPLLSAVLGHGFTEEPRLEFIAEMAAVMLLFKAGLETDVKAFLRAGLPALGIAVAGVVFPFVAGAWITMEFGFSDSLSDPRGLFVGAALTATSVGITARVLGDLGALSTRTGSWILAAAVIDDVLGILVVALLGRQTMGGVDGGTLAMVWQITKALGGWILLTAFCLAAAPVMDRFLRRISPSAGLAVNVAMAFGAAYVAEQIGLAAIIGAYAAGLGFAGKHVAQTMDREIAGVSHFLVPIFFAFVGSQVDLGGFSASAGYFMVLLVAAILTKVVACGLSGRAAGLPAAEALTVGIGMVPRGEVALVVAGMGLAAGIINRDLFSTVVLVALLTTFLTPPLLAWAWRRQIANQRDLTNAKISA